MTVPVYEKKSSGARNYKKDDYCFYCEKHFQSNIRTHYINMHPNEDLVSEATGLALESKERRKMFFKLQQLGNYKHNCKASLSVEYSKWNQCRIRGAKIWLCAKTFSLFPLKIEIRCKYLTTIMIVIQCYTQGAELWPWVKNILLSPLKMEIWRTKSELACPVFSKRTLLCLQFNIWKGKLPVSGSNLISH